MLLEVVLNVLTEGDRRVWPIEGCGCCRCCIGVKACGNTLEEDVLDLEWE